MSAPLRLAVVQILLSFADNALKSAFGFFVTFRQADFFGLSADVSIMIAALALASPYIIFASAGGVLADSIPRARIIKITRLTEIPLAIIAAWSVIEGHTTLLLICIFAYSAQSAIYTTAKLAFLPELASGPGLVSVNALLQTATLGGILAGLIGGGLAIANGADTALAVALIIASVVGYMLARTLPEHPARGGIKLRIFDLNPVCAIRLALLAVFESRATAVLAVSITWFWLVGLVLTSILPDIANRELLVSANTANLLIAGFVLGIAVGGAAISFVARRTASLITCSVAACGMALFFTDLAFAIDAFAVDKQYETIGLSQFLASVDGWRILMDLVAISAFGAAYIAPLYAALQTRPVVRGRALVLSGSVTFDALVSTVAAGSLAILFGFGLTIMQLLLLLALTNVMVAAFLWFSGRLSQE